MKPAMLLIYVVMAAWIVIASVIRIVLQLSAGAELDALPFIGGGLGVLAFLLLLPAYEEWRS